ncbi:Protein kinase [Sorangium cellulosum So ce56]|uniref:Protein kinase n=1 Tax=Sorangium cellulosum (strain So ce56) TaxID=448385 RepID=A9F7H6_SORC5|nr:serine/threonine-protein kinase [Sorangium cellulosum]CAN91538.1 Protein kinase [Sorangium cellulosum So ce56]
MDSPYGLQAGSIIGGDFEVVRPLGAGGTGSVYLCRQHSTARQRAVKVMHPVRAVDPEERRRFEREARAPGLIGSPHIVEVLIAGVDGVTGLPYLAMELLQGETLAACVERAGPLPLAEARRVLGQLGRALEDAHGAGIVHRDLKPENVFLEEAGDGAAPRVKLLDFGIAKIIADARSSLTAAVGTPLWMAPEQARESQGALPQSDVWAYGLLAFFVLTGEPFWQGRDLPALLREILFAPIPTASRRAGELGLPPFFAGFDAWFSRCVERDPLARFTSASAMCPVLERLLDGAARVASTAPASTAPASRRRTSLPLPEASLGAAAARRRSSLPPPEASPAGMVTARPPAAVAACFSSTLAAPPLRDHDDPAPPASSPPPRSEGGRRATRPFLHALDEDHCVATWKGLLFQIWRRHTTAAAVSEVRSILRERGSELQATLVILEENTVPAGREVRGSLAELSRELAAHGMCAALVFEGHGFKASLVRNVAIEFILLSRSRLRYEVFSAMDDAVAWLMRNRPTRDWLQELPGVTEALRREVAAHAARASQMP